VLTLDSALQGSVISRGQNPRLPSLHHLWSTGPSASFHGQRSSGYSELKFVERGLLAFLVSRVVGFVKHIISIGGKTEKEIPRGMIHCRKKGMPGLIV